MSDLEDSLYDEAPDPCAERIADAAREVAQRGSLDVRRLERAIRGVMDTTTRERALPYLDLLAVEYDRLVAPSADMGWAGEDESVDSEPEPDTDGTKLNWGRQR